LLPFVRDIAMFKKEDKELSRGRYYFSANPNQELAKQGLTYLTLAVECIHVWGIWFAEDI
jgi:hypothetical protein